MYQDDQLDSAIARTQAAVDWVESQMMAQTEQQYLQEAFEMAVERHPDVDPQELADNSANFGWDFDAAADGLREFHANNQPAPRTISEAVDRMLADQRAAG